MWPPSPHHLLRLQALLLGRCPEDTEQGCACVTHAARWHHRALLLRGAPSSLAKALIPAQSPRAGLQKPSFPGLGRPGWESDGQVGWTLPDTCKHLFEAPL